jgi:uncharacterized protein (TIGR02001 family)
MAMKKLLLISCVLPLFTVQAEAADFQIPGAFTGTIGMVSDYRFRGITQNDENPALQAAVDYAHDSGFYAGVWGSNVDFNDGDEASLEADFYAGWSGSVSALNWKLGGIYYAYPGASNDLDYDFFEVAGSLGHEFGFAALTAGVNYSPNNFGDSGDATYLSLAASVPFTDSFSGKASIGHQYVDDEDAFGYPDYSDWSVGLGYKFSGFDVGLAYVDTNLSDAECADGCDERVVFSLSRSFQ